MRIAFIAPEAIPVPPLKGGSVEICILSIARELSKLHEVTIYSRTHPSYPTRERNEGIRYIRVPGGAPAGYMARVAKQLQGESYDWIQVDNRPLFLKQVREACPGARLSLFLHSLTFVQHPRTLARLGAADLILANSGSLRHELSIRFPSLKHKLVQVYLGVDIHRFRPPTPAERNRLRREHGLEDAFVIAFAGRIIPRKGLKVLLQALYLARKSNKRLHLLLVGSPMYLSYRNSLLRTARRLRVPVTSLGYVPHSSMHLIYRMADCFVCPSQKHEAFGLVNAEAMATGLPVIASDIGGISELIRSGHNGALIADYRKPEAFAAAILALAKDPEAASRLGEQGRLDVMERFSWKHSAGQLERIYQTWNLGERGSDPYAALRAQQIQEDGGYSS